MTRNRPPTYETDGARTNSPVTRRPDGTGADVHVRPPFVETSTLAVRRFAQSTPMATIRVLDAAIDVGQNPDTTDCAGATDHDRPPADSQTRVVVLLPSRTNATKPRGPAASLTNPIPCGPVAADVQIRPSVEL